MAKRKLATTTRRHWLGSVAVYLLVSLTLFAFGGELAWWHAWVFSALIVGAGVGGRIWAERRHPGLLAERQGSVAAEGVKSWDKVLAPLMGVSLAFPLVIVAGLDHRHGWSPVFPIWLNVLGFASVALGYAFAVWAIVENPFFSTVVRIQTDRAHSVCDSGPYRIVRHPGCAGNLLALPGIVLAMGSQ